MVDGEFPLSRLTIKVARLRDNELNVEQLNVEPCILTYTMQVWAWESIKGIAEHLHAYRSSATYSLPTADSI